MSPYRTVGSYENPPEAGRVAGEFRAAAQAVREIHFRVTRMGGQLGSSWYGNASRVFFQSFDPATTDLLRLAEQFEGMANEVSQMQVWVEHQEWYDEQP